MEKKIDKYQDKAIKILDNAVVSAGAGSGKTTVLAERFLYLVQKENPLQVDEILTLTFTKKATTEMSSRIYKTLKNSYPEKAKDFYKSNIKTLDSYCNSIAKMACHYYGISPDFTQDQDAIEDAANEMGLPFLLENKNNEGIQNIIKYKDNFSNIAKEVFIDPIIKYSTITSPIKFKEDLENQCDFLISEWNKNYKKINSLILSIKDEVENCQGNTEIKFIKNITQLLIKHESLNEFNFTKDDLINENFEELENYLLSLYNIATCNQSGATKECYQCIKSLLNELRTYIAKGDKNIKGSLIGIFNFFISYKTVKSVVPLLEEFQEKINNYKRTSSTLCFSDISDLARIILRDFPEIRQIEKEKYKAIMIDEFQDNNEYQKEMLFLLSEKLDRKEKSIPKVEELITDKLFFVGDEKQSIYKFRGADVSVFRSLSDDFKNGNLTMSTNYRSCPALIACFNTIFGGINYPNYKNLESANAAPKSVFFTEKDNDIPKYEAEYKEVFLPEQKANELNSENANLKETYKPRIHFAYFKQNSEEKVSNKLIVEEEAEANWITEKIIELHEKGINGSGPIEYSNIAILFQKYKSQPTYERYLLSKNIPYNTGVVKGFFQDGPINDLISFLKICVNENDFLSYANILTSPFTNLTVEEAEAVISNSTSYFENNVEEILYICSQERFLKTKELYEEIKKDCSVLSLTELITKLWYTTGYYYETLWNKKLFLYQKLYDLLFEFARTSEEKNLSISSFIDEVCSYESIIEKLDGMDIPLEESSGVNLLSIHKSKGLEYDIVFICGTHELSNPEKRVKISTYNKKYGYSLNLPAKSKYLNCKNSNYFFDQTNELNKKMDEAELKRLTYVAITRAKKEVFITNGKYDNSDKETLNSIFNVLKPSFDFYFENNSLSSPFDYEEIPSYEREKNQNTSQENTKANKLNLIKSIDENNFYNNSEILELESVKSKYAFPSQLHPEDDETFSYTENSITSLEDIPYSEINKIIEESIPNGETKPKFSYQNFGTIAHSYMESIFSKKEIRLSNKDIIGIENEKSKIETVKSICEKMKTSFMKSEIGILAENSSWIKTEFEFRSKIENKILKGFIDLVFKDKENNVYILDYKTNQEIKPEIYVLQLACYRQAISQILNIPDASKIKCLLHYLRFDKTVDISADCDKVDISQAIKNFE